MTRNPMMPLLIDARFSSLIGSICAILVFLGTADALLGQDSPRIPHQQTKPPGPALSPEEALAKMQVPKGFRVELVAAEPDLMNPVAMAFDDRGRIFVTESFEYPRREPGPGRDRIKILEDTDGDGRVDNVKIFAEGLNIPSGIAVGHGGVWVANAPDILFLEDTDGDDVADRTSVVVTGFGRDDTHELPNALTWGPDGYLYGLNGVFNRSVVQQDDRVYDFTCALFRIHPRTRRFELFCQGTSNPWGVAFDAEGSAFVSACVIDHLWHLTESAYYLRQGGPYPPHTWWAESIVQHKHQMAAYCGIEYFDSAAYPESYRGKLFMGNIHGGCINVDRIERFGATYQGFGEPDFLTANDVWFMPVAQKVGPDGCLYVLDWYDRYHCYQDAMADPKGIDRGRGRLYRVVHESRPAIRYADIDRLSNAELVEALRDENIFNRQRAQLKLAERSVLQEATIRRTLEGMVIGNEPLKTKMHALWAMAGAGKLSSEFLSKLMRDAMPEMRAWGVRLGGDHQPDDPMLAEQMRALASDTDPRVRVQVAIAAPKVTQRASDAGEILLRTELEILKHSSDDPILPRVVWQNMLPVVNEYPSLLMEELMASGERPSDLLRGMAPRLAAKWVAGIDATLKDDAGRARLDLLLQVVRNLSMDHPDTAAAMLMPLVTRVRNGEILVDVIQPSLRTLAEEGKLPSKEMDAWGRAMLIVRLICGDADAATLAGSRILDRTLPSGLRRELLTYVALHPTTVLSQAVQQVLDDLASRKEVEAGYRDAVLDVGISKADATSIDLILSSLPHLSSEVQAGIAERMCQREPAASALLRLVAENRVRKELISPNRIRLLAVDGSASAKAWVSKIWGTVNIEGSKERDEVVRRVGEQLRKDARGNAERGWQVYERICGQCHVMHGRGVEVGPNITANGRGSFEQLLVSVFHPSLVIGDAFKSVTIRTEDGTIITGLLVARDEDKTVVKVQGGKETTVPASEIAEFRQDSKSLMPEGIESQLSPQELADLFALLTLEKPPGSPDNTILSGTPPSLHRLK